MEVFQKPVRLGIEGSVKAVEKNSHDEKPAEVMVEERERCAKTSESLYDVTYWDDPVAGIAAKIRAGVQ